MWHKTPPEQGISNPDGRINTEKLNVVSAKNGSGAPFHGYFKPEDPKDLDNSLYFLHDAKTNKKIGFIDFSITSKNKDEAVFICQMENYTRDFKENKCRGVGNLLYEFVIYKMAESGLSCPIQLLVAGKSWVFHYKNGFRFKDDKDNEQMEKFIKELRNAVIDLPITEHEKHIQGIIDKCSKNKFPENMSMPLATVLEKIQPYTKQNRNVIK